MIEKWVRQGAGGGWNVVGHSGRVLSHHQTKVQALRWVQLVEDQLVRADQPHAVAVRAAKSAVA